MQLTLKEAGRLINQQRKRVPRQCDVCGKEFVGFTYQRYCSRQCSARAMSRRCYWRRKKQLSEGGQTPEGKQTPEGGQIPETPDGYQVPLTGKKKEMEGGRE